MGKNDPSSPAKFALGLILVGAGFAVLVVAAQLAQQGVQVSPMWLTVTYFLHTCGELMLSPVGLSAMTKLAPVRIAGLMMGVWFLATSVGNYIGGRARVVLRVLAAADPVRRSVAGRSGVASAGSDACWTHGAGPMKRLMRPMSRSHGAN